MVVTRSRLAIQGDHAEEKNSKKVRRNNFVITIAPKPTVVRKKPAVRIVQQDDPPSDHDDRDDREEDDDGQEEEDTEDSSSSPAPSESNNTEGYDDDEEEFDLPSHIMENAELRPLAEEIIQSIKQKSPSLESILRAPVRQKHKEELFEWFLIYDQCMPMSEERMVLRKQVHGMLENYKKEYTEFSKHKEMVAQLEKNEHHDDVCELQFDILRLETSEAHKRILFQKYSELKEKEDMDEEFYKLKGWLRQALQLPFDRIKSFPRFDNVTEQLMQIKTLFDEELYGMEKVKEQLLLFIHGKIMNPDMKGCCLGLVGEPGVGKCLHPLTPVLMLDGEIRVANTLSVGDVLMGDDSRPRVIQSMCTGEQLMYRIVQQNGDPYIVNSSHILSLYHTKSGTVRDVPISEYVRYPKKRQDDYQGVKTGVFFPSKKRPMPEISPRTMGRLWATQIAPNRFPLSSLSEPGLEVVEDHEDREEDDTAVGCLRDESAALFLEKHQATIPAGFRINDTETRLEFLRGIAEGCGVQHDRGVVHLFLPRKRHRDTLYLARSLGLLAHASAKNQCITVMDPLGMLAGGTLKDPVLATYEITVQKLDVQPYVGFIVDGNHRYLLGDFTITHNTSIARCLAKVLDFPFEQISFGGVHHSDFIKGFDFTYVGSRPGEIARCLTRMNYKNGILFLDEYEKVAENPEITSTLLHITDFSQNNVFRDNYFNDVTIDLSSLWFVYSMNDLPRDKALKDRIYSIVVDGYSEKEKVRIASDYLFPKNLANLGKTREDVVLDDQVVGYLVRKVCSEEKGIRTLEKAVRDVLNKIHFLVSNQDKLPCSFMLPSTCFPLTFPVVLTEKMVDVFLKTFSSSSPVPSFYV